MPFFDVDPHRKRRSMNKKESSESQPSKQQSYVQEQLEEWATIMQDLVEIKDYPNGWLSTHKRCFKGNEMYKWILENAEKTPRKAA